ncbi:MAG: amino acid ABC transporter permease [Devosia sp.]
MGEWLPYIVMGIPLTLAIWVLSFGLGTVMALGLAVVRTRRTPVLNQFAIAFIEFFRITPPLLHVIWVYYAFPMAFGIRLSGFSVAVIALSGSTAALMAEVFRSGLQSVPHGQSWAAKVLGLNSAQALRYVILPQTLRLIMPPTVGIMVIALKETSLAAIIAVPEMMHRAQVISAQTFKPLEVLTLVAFLYFVLTYPLILYAGRLERRVAAAYAR